MDTPVTQFDPTREAIIDPEMMRLQGLVTDPVVVCFFREAIEQIVAETGGVTTAHLYSEIGASPVYQVPWNGVTLGLAHPGVGAPLCAASLEELIMLGGRRFLACGSAGVLVPGIPLGEVLVPTQAVRDEGTSYHYLPASEPALPTTWLMEHACDQLEQRRIAFRRGKTWTTDAVYRETRGRMQARIEQGCISVDMEASAFFAVARFRKVEFAQLFYASDDLSGSQWDSRDFLNRTDARMRLLRLALDIASALPATPAII